VAYPDGVRWLAISALLTCVAAVNIARKSGDASAKGTQPTPPHLHRPVALALTQNGSWLFVANRASGGVSVIDTTTRRAVAELPVGRKLADAVLTRDDRQLLVVDEEANELIVLAPTGPELRLVSRVAVGTSPVSVRPSADGKRCMVASVWARQLSVVEFTSLQSEDKKPRVSKVIALPFAPRSQLPVPHTDKVIVADAFGGNLAVVDVLEGRVDSVRTLPAHQIRGLAWSPDGQQLLLSHQVLHGDARTTQADIHWGNLIVNYVRTVSRAELLRPDSDLLKGSRLFALGDVEHGTGDPAGLAVGPDGTIVVALAGVDEVALGSAQKSDWSYLGVGRRPTSVVIDTHRGRAFVANTLSDSVTVLDLSQKTKPSEISLGSQPTLSPADRGELLFYDARLSLEGWLSCNSCHVDGHTNGLLNDNLSDGSFGTPKRVLSLLGVKDTGPWAWNGSVRELKDQVHKSIEVTMRGTRPTDEQVEDLVAFLGTLAPPPPRRPESATVEAATRRGKELFHEQGCAGCHTPPAYTSAKTYDVGLADEAGNKLFNPPSLRAVVQGGPYFHDNRAAILDDVFRVHRHQLKQELAKEELADLLSFLRSL
jgi:YVTN family beta-propeller protein